VRNYSAKSFWVFSFLVLSLSSNALFAQEVSNERTPSNPEISFTDQADVPRGFYMGITGGYWYFLNDEDRSTYGDAWVTGIKFGYDILKYLAVELQYRWSAHQDAQRGVAARTVPGSHWSHQAQLMLRGAYPISRRWTVSLEGGGGLWLTRPNIKPTISQDGRGIGTGGLGVQYFTKIKGVVIGMDPSMSIAQDLAGPILQVTGYVRYTF